MRMFLAISAALFTALAVYALPVTAEMLMLRAHMNPWLVCVWFADLAGCVFLFALGFRMVSILVYGVATVLEMTGLFAGLPPEKLVWMTNLLPALTGAVLMVRIALRWLVQPGDL